jgi:prepilin-type N-terminal cleavage/methylation domain-containing protein
VKKYQKGFTLIELLIVIGIIAVLIGVFVTTVNLGRPFEQARDAQRNANVSAIAGALKSRMADNRGVWTSGGTTGCPAIGTTPVNIIASTSGWVGPGAAGAALQGCLVDKYMLVIPQDPSLEAASDSVGVTGYKVKIEAGRVTVSAPFYEGDTPISITN